MTSVESSDSQPATGLDFAMVPDTRGEEVLPRSESGMERIKPSDYDDIVQLDESLRQNDTNWLEWRSEMIPIFELCGVEGYVKEALLRPDPNVDPEWSYNHTYTRLIFSSNVTQSQKAKNTSMCNSAHEVWSNLEAANSYHDQASEALFAYGRELYHTTAGDHRTFATVFDILVVANTICFFCCRDADHSL